jgi:hypothetical protein
MMSDRFSTDRRGLLAGAAATAALLAPAAGLAQSRRTSDRDAIRAAVDAGYEDSVRRIQQWIALPTIAAEQLNIQEGADYMARLATEAGFTGVRKIPTGGSPVVFGRLDAGARRTVGIYFMYDVKQFDPAEWASPPLEGRIVDLPQGRAIRGRGAVNQKGPEGAFLAALHAFRAAGRRLPVNLVLLAEGEEEIGSPHFPDALRDPEALAAMRTVDGVIIRPPRRARTARSRSASAPRASSSASWSQPANAGARAGPRRSFEPERRRSTARSGTWSRRSTRWSPIMATGRRSTAGSSMSGR